MVKKYLKMRTCVLVDIVARDEDSLPCCAWSSHLHAQPWYLGSHDNIQPRYLGVMVTTDSAMAVRWLVWITHTVSNYQYHDVCIKTPLCSREDALHVILGSSLFFFLDENLGVPQSSQISHSGSTLTRTQSTDSGIIPPMLGSNKKRDVSHDSKKKKQMARHGSKVEHQILSS